MDDLTIFLSFKKGQKQCVMVYFMYLLYIHASIVVWLISIVLLIDLSVDSSERSHAISSDWRSSQHPEFA